jgi:MFS family permease
MSDPTLLYTGASTRAHPPTVEDVGRCVDRHAIAQSALVQLTGGVFLTGFALALGASPRLIGVLAAVPLLIKLSQLVLSWRIERAGHWREAALRGALLGRAVTLLALAIPFLPFAPPHGALALIAVIAVSSLGAAIHEMAYLTWMAELIPESGRGAFFGRRARTAGLSGLAIGLAAGFALDRISGGRTPPAWAFGMIFALGALAGLAGLAWLARVPSPRREHSRVHEERPTAPLRRPLADPNFRRLLMFVAAWSLAGGLGAPFYTVFMLERIGLTFFVVTALGVGTSALLALTQLHWGRLADHFGARTVMRATSMVIALVPLAWIAAAPGRAWPVIPIQIAAAFAWGGYHLSLSTLMLKLAPPDARPSYLAAFAAVQGTCEAVASMLGGLLLAALLDGRVSDPLRAFHWLFGISAALFALAVPLLGRVQEPGSASVGHMLRVMGRFRAMEATFPQESLLYDFVYTHLARIADFVVRDQPGGTPASSDATRARAKRAGASSSSPRNSDGSTSSSSIRCQPLAVMQPSTRA